MGLINDYLEYHKEYTKKFGNKCIILLQNGSFFEVYALDDEGPNIFEIGEVLNMIVTRRNKEIPTISLQNPRMMGFNLVKAHEHIETLTQNGYTCVLVEQTEMVPKIKREVTRIVSPSLIMSNNNSNNNNFLMCLFFHINKTYKTLEKFISCSISIIDINTNEIFLFDCMKEDSDMNLQDIVRIISTYGPSEIIYFTNNETKLDDELFLKIKNFSKNNINSLSVHNNFETLIDDNFYKISYQKKVLEKVYYEKQKQNQNNLLSIIEYLDLETKPSLITCFVYLIDFIYKHDEKIINGLQKPVIIEENRYLSLINNVIYHLDIISSKDNKNYGKTTSILTLLNNTKTMLGKRFFKNALVNPLLDKNEIQNRYDLLKKFKENKFYFVVRESYLQKISDIQRLCKRMSVKILHPQEFVLLISSIKVFNELILILKENNIDINFYFEWTDDNNKQTFELIENITKKFDEEQMNKFNLNQIKKNIFLEGVFEEIDKIQKDIETNENIYNDILIILNGVQQPFEFKLDINSREERSFLVTKNRWVTLNNNKTRKDKIEKELKKKFNMNISDDFDVKPLSSKNTTQYKIILKNFNNDVLIELQTKLKEIVEEKYLQEIEKIFLEYNNYFKKIINFIGYLDFICCNAKNADENYYNEPQICNENEDYSFIKATKIRHPLIEKLQTDTAYISNDIEIGTKNNKGILLYGMNSAGKSSLMKSIGINLIMAQCGMFVACDSFVYSPYKEILSRFPSGDNLHKGQSTFICEINEIRTILKRSGKNSLVLGDELATGTELISSISIVASGIKSLIENQSSFLFATHLHEICDLKFIKENLDIIKIKHLEVSFDKENNCLVFDRKLKDGNGEKLYGLEIAKSLNLPSHFILFANDIRNELQKNKKNFVELKQSLYNEYIIMDECAICNEMCEEVHHIQEQHTANEFGIIRENHLHKNHKSNLLTLCKQCHQRIHKNDIKIIGYVLTTNGVKLNYEILNEKQEEEDNIQIRKECIKLRINGFSYKKILNELKEKYENLTLGKVKNFCM
jgi:DNA mismatch repair protein MutS